MTNFISFQSLGNHEFDEDVDGVIPFIRNLTSPVLAANLILDKVPDLRKEENLQNSVVLSVNGVEIGIIGYLTPDTKFLAPKNKVEYEDEIIAIRREVEQLKNRGVKILIALGHSGFVKDLQIAKNVEDLDLVIGGHSNTFLVNSNKTNEKPEFPQGPYPTVVKQATGREVLVVQAYAYTKYLGRLHLVFDANGEIVKYDGKPQLLNQIIPEDPEIKMIVDNYRKDLDRINNEIIERGISSVYLDGDCRLRECNLGDLICDAILNFTRRYYKEYSDVNIAIVQGGRIRASIDRPQRPFQMTKGDWMTVLPFSDSLAVVTMNGTLLKRTLEHSVSTWRVIDSTGQFLQFAGMEVIYDLAKPSGSRIVKAKAICSKCENQNMSEIQDAYEYKLMMPLFLADGGDGYTFFENLPKEIVKFNELDTCLDYIKHYGPIDMEVDGRLQIVNEDIVDSFPDSLTSEEKSDGENDKGSKGFMILPYKNLYGVICILCLFFYK